MVSVVIPTYNHEALIVRTLESVFAQTFTDYEVIVVNDGSPDRTTEIVHPFIASKRIRYIEQANAGQAAARNRGITEAHGKFIALLDDDDLWPPDSLQRRVETLQQSPDAPLAYGGVMLIDGTDAPINEDERKRLGIEVPTSGPAGDVYAAFAKRNYILSPGQTLLRRALLTEPTFDASIWGCDDYDLYLRLAERGEFIFVDGAPVLRYRFHAGNASRDFARMHLSEMKVFAAHLRRHRESGVQRYTDAIAEGMRGRRWNLAKYWLRRSLIELREGNLNAARSSGRTLYRLWRIGS